MTRIAAKNEWHPASWQALPAAQQPTYPDQAALDRAVADLSRLPPLVTSWEIDALKDEFARAQRGEAFILQGGDCAETFDECTSENIVAKLKILLQMSLVILYGLKKPVIRVGRMAGQYAKPRSADTETREGQSLPSFRGDLVNRNPFTASDRVPDPQLILRGYERAALTLNFVRSLIRNTGTSTGSAIRRWRTNTMRSSRRYRIRWISWKRSPANPFTRRAGRTFTQLTKVCTCCTSRRRHASWIGVSAGTT